MRHPCAHVELWDRGEYGFDNCSKTEVALVRQRVVEGFAGDVGGRNEFHRGDGPHDVLRLL